MFCGVKSNPMPPLQGHWGLGLGGIRVDMHPSATIACSDAATDVACIAADAKPTKY